MVGSDTKKINCWIGMIGDRRVLRNAPCGGIIIRIGVYGSQKQRKSKTRLSMQTGQLFSRINDYVDYVPA